MIDKNKKLFFSTEQEHREKKVRTKKKWREEEEHWLRKQTQAKGRRKMEAVIEGQREAGFSPDAAQSLFLF